MSKSSVNLSPSNAKKIEIGNSSIVPSTFSYYITATSLTANVDVVSSSSEFLMSTSSSGPWTSSLSLPRDASNQVKITVYVRFSPVGSAGAKSATFSHTSTGAATNNLPVSGFALAAKPSSAATIVSATPNASNPSNAIDVTFNAGNGDGRALVIRPSVLPTVYPANGQVYLNINDFTNTAATIDELDAATTTRIVYIGSGTSVTVTGLSSGTLYRLRIVEYNNSGISGAENYLVGGTSSNGAVTTGASGYTWTGAVDLDFQNAGNWSPSRNSISSSDQLIFSSSPAGPVTNVPTQTIAALTISGTGTAVEFQAASGGATLTIAGTTGLLQVFTVASGCSFTVSGANVLTLSTPSKNASITGNITLKDASHTITATAASWTFNSPSTFTYDGSSSIAILGFNYYNLTLSATGSMTAPASFSVKGNFVGSNTFVHNNGTVIFNGASQSISGTATFYNVTIAGGGQKIISSGAANVQYLSGDLTFSTSAALTTNGNLFLLSTASRTGSIGVLSSTSQLNGSITVQRYLPAGVRNANVHISAPVSGASVSSLQPTSYTSNQPNNGIYITGPFTGSSNPGYGINANGKSMFTFGASSGAYVGFPLSSNGEVLAPGVGYRCIVRDGGSGYFNNQYIAKTLTVSGTPNKGSQNYSLSYSPTGGGATNPDGWNLIGNPYPSNISANLSNPGWNTGSANLLESTVYIWDSHAGNYVTCLNGSGNCVIPSFQGFWVRTANGGGTLSSTENVKVSGSLTLYREASQPSFSIKLQSSSFDGWDLVTFNISPDGTVGYDKGVDASEPLELYDELTPYVLGIYSYQDKQAMSINTISSKSSRTSLKVHAPAGPALLEFGDLSSISVPVYLYDKEKDAYVDLHQSSSYGFYAGYAMVNGEERFEIVVGDDNLRQSTSSTVIEHQLIVYPNPANGVSQVKADGITDASVVVTVADMFGNVLLTIDATTSNGQINLPVDFSGLKKGVYTVSCKGSTSVYTNKLVVE